MVEQHGGGTLIRLDSQHSSWLLYSDGGIPSLAYLGPRLAGDSLLSLTPALARPVQPATLDDPEPLTLLPETGTGFLGHPGIIVHRSGRQFITQLELEEVTEQDQEVRFSCRESLAELQIELTLRLDPDSDVMSMQSRVINRGTAPLNVEWLAAACIALPDEHDQVELFGGRWARELDVERYAIGGATLMKENRHGRTSHKSSPTALTGPAGFSATTGAVLAAHLGWSGNHRLLVERSRDGRPLLQLGELLAPGEVVLEAGDSYRSPPAFLTRSASGSNVLMHNFHRFVRETVLPRDLAARPRPVNFNTWEACYFEHSHERTLSFVAQAKALGAERFVLDDGWFVGRNDDHAGLGDWTVCKKKYPHGLEPIAAAISDAGMEFGLWLEPEMVNADSDLYRAHPDWVLGDAGREQPLGRHQLVLNLTRDDVFDHLLTVITGLIRRYRPGYIKWDMNRDLTHAVSAGRPAGHAMTVASYRLLAAVRERCPDTEIEICSSGGARADYGALRFGERIWTSDNHDPHDRQLIQRGFSLLFPPEVMGSHVGGSPNEITGRRHSIGFRVATALAGHFGIELTKRPLSDVEADCIRRGTQLYKQHRDWLHRGRCDYLPQRDPNLIVRQQTAADQTRALVCAAQIGTPTDGVPLRLRLVGLRAASQYQLTLRDPDNLQPTQQLALPGVWLMQVGIQLPLLQPDSALLIELAS